MKKESYQAINANVMLPHPCDRNHALVLVYKSGNYFDKVGLSYYEAVEEAHKVMNEKKYNPKEIKIVQVQAHWKFENKPEWVRQEREV